MNKDMPSFSYTSIQKKPVTGLPICRTIECHRADDRLVLRIIQENKDGTLLTDEVFVMGEDEVDWLMYGLRTRSKKKK